MPTLTIQFEKLKQRFGGLDQDVLDSFIHQHGKLTELFIETLENFLLTKHIEQQEDTVNVILPTTTTPTTSTATTTITLPNARQKEAYHHVISGFDVVSAVHFSEECGLNWDDQTQTISGVPTLGGKEIAVIFTLADGSQHSIPLYINADPRSLWHNIPSEQLVTEFWKPDSACALQDSSYGKLIAARMRGRSHAHKGTCCDDDFAFGYHDPTGIHFFAVADGAGSAEYSRLGSKVAVEKAKECFFDILNDVSNNLNSLPNQTEEKVEEIANSLLYKSIAAAYKAQQDKVSANITHKSLSCTLLLAFTLPLASGKWFSAAYWVGDGAVAIFDSNTRQVFLLGKSDGGQYSGETQFLTKAEFDNNTWKTRITKSLSQQAPILFVMTDGVSDPKFANDAALSQAEPWAALWSELQEPLSQAEPDKALEQWLDFWSVGEHDDRTLAMFIPNHYLATSSHKNDESAVCTTSAPINESHDISSSEATVTHSSDAVFNPESAQEHVMQSMPDASTSDTTPNTSGTTPTLHIIEDDAINDTEPTTPRLHVSDNQSSSAAYTEKKADE